MLAAPDCHVQTKFPGGTLFSVISPKFNKSFNISPLSERVCHFNLQLLMSLRHQTGQISLGWHCTAFFFLQVQSCDSFLNSQIFSMSPRLAGQSDAPARQFIRNVLCYGSKTPSDHFPVFMFYFPIPRATKTANKWCHAHLSGL